jgi:iron complex outermembrane recepter protein
MKRWGAVAGTVGIAGLLFSTGVASEIPAQEKGAEIGDATRNNVFQLGEIEVVGQKDEENKNKTVEKIYNDEMRLFNTNDLADAVNLLPGITLSEMGARNEKMVYVRGFDIKHVPIYIDGIPIYVPYDGYPDLSRFNTFDLSEVTVSKGFASVLYGPNTMGGAINMVSRRPTKEFEGEAGAGFASGDTYHAFANLGSNRRTWYFQGGASYLDSDHFSVSDDFKATKTQPGGDRLNSYRTDWKANLKIGLTPNKTDEYALSYINQQAEKGVPPYTGTDSRVTTRYWQWPYWDKESVYFNSNTSILEKSYVKTRLYYDIFKNSLYSYDDSTYTTITKGYAFRSWYDDYTYGGSLEAGTQLLPKNFLKAAFHYKDDVHREHNEGYPLQHFQDQSISIGLEDTIDITSKFYTIVGVSYDRVETVEAQDLISKTKTLKDFPLGTTDAYNPQLGLFYKLTDTDTVHTSIAQKTRLPSIKDKFSYRLGTALPNPDLQPEESVNYEVGYKGNIFKRFTAEANLFYSDVSDYILLKTIPDPSNPGKTVKQNQNIGDISQYGVELGLSGQILTSLNGGISYTYIQYENKSTSDMLLDIPHDKVFAYLQYLTPLVGLSFLGSVEYNTDRYSSTDGVRVAEGYTLINAKAMYEIYKGLTVETGIDNITDENYAIDEGYPLEGRTYFMNLTYKF